jgi:hypothetical protein
MATRKLLIVDLLGRVFGATNLEIWTTIVLSYDLGGPS